MDEKVLVRLEEAVEKEGLPSSKGSNYGQHCHPGAVWHLAKDSLDVIFVQFEFISIVRSRISFMRVTVRKKESEVK